MYKTLLITIAFIMLFLGCSTKELSHYDYRNELKDAPDWVFEVNTSPYTAVASAKVTPAGLNFAETEATALAKDKIARQINTQVSNVVRQFTQTTGAGNAIYIDKVIADISRQISTQELSSSRVEKKWISQTGFFYIKLSVEPSIIKSTINKNFRSGSVEHQQFLSKEAQKELDEYLNKL